MAMCISASRREHMPELAMYLFKRISSGFDFLAGVFLSVCCLFGADETFLIGAFPLAKLLLLTLSFSLPEVELVSLPCRLPEDFPFPLLP